MHTYIITRANGWANADELKAKGAISARIGDEEMPDKVRWIRSYVTRHEGGRIGTVCIYQATDPEAIREHARRVGMPGPRSIFVGRAGSSQAKGVRTPVTTDSDGHPWLGGRASLIRGSFCQLLHAGALHDGAGGAGGYEWCTLGR